MDTLFIRREAINTTKENTFIGKLKIILEKRTFLYLFFKKSDRSFDDVSVKNVGDEPPPLGGHGGHGGSRGHGGLGSGAGGG